MIQLALRPMCSPVRYLGAATFLMLALTHVAQATSYVMMKDSVLADRSPVIALVNVTGIEPGPAQRIPSTDYLVDVQRVVSGDLPGSTIVVRVPGGVRADGIGLKLWGMPEFAIGEEALLFLVPDRDGSFQIEHLLLGAFHVRRQPGVGTLALRDLSEAHQINLHGENPQEPTRELGAFVEWLADRAQGLRRAADYAVPAPSGPSALFEKFILTVGSDSNAVRWFAFDGGKIIRWQSQSAGQPGLTAAQTADSITRALAAWTNDPTSKIDYSYAGTTTASSGLRSTDGINAVLFNDPGAIIPGAFDCNAGGILATGGPFYYTSVKAYRGRNYHEILEADVITNDGAQCFYQNNPVGAEEVFAHELGHTLGFSHSAEKESLMWAAAHNDGRGARLHDDDRMAASTVYGDGSFTPPPPPPPPPPVPAPVLTAASGSRSVLLSWKTSLTNVQSFRIESKKGTGAFTEIATVAASSRQTTIGGLTAGTIYVYRMRVLLTTGVLSGYSNEAQAKALK